LPLKEEIIIIFFERFKIRIISHSFKKLGFEKKNLETSIQIQYFPSRKLGFILSFEKHILKLLHNFLSKFCTIF
jgi:hypothetical protein